MRWWIYLSKEVIWKKRGSRGGYFLLYLLLQSSIYRSLQKKQKNNTIHLLTRRFQWITYCVTENKAFGLQSLMAVNSQKATLACKWNISHHIVRSVKFETDVFVQTPGLSLDWWDSNWLLNNEASSQQEGTRLIPAGRYLLRLSCSPFMTTMKYNCIYTLAYPYHGMIKQYSFCNYSMFKYPAKDL